jgi:hypothetical protein
MFIRDLSWAADRVPKEDEVPYGPYNRLEDVYSACEVVSLDAIKDKGYEQDLDEAIDFDDFWDCRQAREEILMGWC